MQHEDRELQRVLASFEVMPPAYLAQRIVANATVLPQRRGFFGTLSQAMSEWNYALAYKGMALACFMMLGAALAQQQTQTLNYVASSDMSSLVIAQGWMED